MNIRNFFLTLMLLLSFGFTYGEELQCVVEIQAPSQGSDKQIYVQMEEAMSKYVNFRKWSDLKFEPAERIKCRMLFIINNRPSIDEFSGTLQVQLIRPVYNSTYESLVLNLKDKNINFKFTAFQPLEFSDNNYIDELTSLLNFYCYMLVGFDQETFELRGGTASFQKAQNIVNLAASNGLPGWKNYDGTQNRAWLVTDVLDNSLAKIHNFLYVYHRQGLDQMEKNLTLARKTMVQGLRDLQVLNQRYPNKYITRIFITAKGPEILQVFAKAEIQEKRDLVAIMMKLDPSRTDDYADLMKN